jgi:hypothetical protein
MSFSNAPDADMLGRVAGALAVDEAFIEKDWFVVEAIRVLVGLGTDEFTPVFSGGTSLLKGHGLIKRFSEDIDFKLALSEPFLAKSQGQRKKSLSAFKHGLAKAWEAGGFTNLQVEAGSGNAYIRIEMDYPSVLDGHDALRPHILAELSAKPPRLAPHECALTSFVARFRRDAPEVASIPCVDPVETAADKLSALAWRVIVRKRGDENDDPTIIRHVHDLAVLEAIVAAHAQFGALLAETLLADTDRGGGAVADLPPKERLDAMLAKLAADEEYESDYRRFVEAMAFAEAGEIPSYEAAVQALHTLSKRLSE